MIRMTTPDLSQCDQEPIQYIEAIQPHGALVIVEEPTLRIVQYSANLAAFLGLAGSVGHGQFLAQWLGDTHTQALHAALADRSLDQAYVHLLTLHGLGQADASFHVFANRSDGLLLLEFERSDSGLAQGCGQLWRSIREAFPAMKPDTLSYRLAVVCGLIRTHSGFERVMIYRFQPDRSGAVIAESLQPGLGLQSYLNLHFPAGDIPLPAHRLFKLRTLRFLPDVHYQPVPLLPGFAEAGLAHPVNLGASTFRSVSPMYTEYLQNMGVQSTLIMPILIKDEIWGMIACHQYSTTHYLDFTERGYLELNAAIISLEALEYTESSQREYISALRQSLLNQQERATLEIHLHTDAAALANLRLLEALRADGVAICLADQLVLQGSTPGESAVRQLVLWLGEQPGYLYASDCLGADYPPADAWGDTAAGIMAIRPTPNTTLVWFRKEYQQTINWAGNPDKPAADTQGEVHPRRSFALWRQLTRGQSRPWLDCERDYVQQLHEFLAEVLAYRLELCSQLAGQPRAIGPTELENFLYSAAHDLSEPLRGIKNYTQLIQLQEKQALSNRNGGRLDSVLRLAERMEDNLRSLLNLAVAGETTLTLRLHSLQSLVQEVADIMTALFSQRALRIEIVSDLPEMRCDAAKVTSIYQNLIQNAIKYNESAIASIRIGHYLMQNRPVFFVKDNGIGIPTEYHSTIFQLFRRLHDGTRYGGGSGVGMSIIKKAVQSHGGHIWLESAPGEGSSFYFTLEPAVRS